MGPAFGLQGDVQMNWGVVVMDGSLFFQLHRGPVAYNSLSPSVLNGTRRGGCFSYLHFSLL